MEKGATDYFMHNDPLKLEKDGKLYLKPYLFSEHASNEQYGKFCKVCRRSLSFSPPVNPSKHREHEPLMITLCPVETGSSGLWERRVPPYANPYAVTSACWSCQMNPCSLALI